MEARHAHTKREGQRVQELDLDQWALSVEVELKYAHDVHKDDQEEDQDVGALVLDFLYHHNCGERQDDLRDFKVGCFDCAASCV